jgi:hypothetical protein
MIEKYFSTTNTTLMRICVIFIAIILFACRQQANNKISPNTFDTSKSSPVALPHIIYQFDSSTYVTGCADVLLQKISNDMQYELKLELDIDSIPKFAEIDISKYSKFIKIYFNKFSKDNKYIEPICNDYMAAPKDWKPPTEYIAIAGSLTITYWSDKESIVSAITKNLVVQDSAKEVINLPLENFEKLSVHWLGG